MVGTPFFGREPELGLLRALLDDPANRLITITGPAGVGKSRIALELVGTGRRFEDRVAVVEFDEINEPGEAIRRCRDTIASIGVIGSTNEWAGECGGFLIVLDNVDQVRAAASDLVRELARHPSLTLLVTCRRALNLRSERCVRIDPFAAAQGQFSGLGSAGGSPAITLFEDRARASDAGFCLADQLPAVARLCDLLGGLPLAIELAAARSRLFPPAALADLLDETPDEALELLSGGALDAPQRQRSIVAAIDCSYRLLGESEQQLLRALAGAPAGMSLGIAKVVAARAGLAAGEWTGALDSLASEHLITILPADVPAPGPLGAIPSTMLNQRVCLSPLVASFCRKRAESDEIQRAQAEAIETLAEQVAPKLTSPQHGPWTRWLRAEQANLRAALAWCLSDSGDVELAYRLSASVWRAWSYTTAFEEGIGWLRRVLALPAPNPASERWSRDRARVLLGCGQLCWQHGEYTEARDYLHECIRLAESVGDARTAAFAVLDLGHVGFNDGHVGESLSLDEAVQVFRDHHDRWALATALVPLAYAAISRGYLPAAQRALDESRRLFLASGDSWGIAVAALCESRLALQQGDIGLADLRANESLGIFASGHDRWRLAATHSLLGQIAQYLGDYSRAHRHFADGIAISREVGHQRSTARLLRSLAGLVRQQDEIGHARALYEEAFSLSQRLGDDWGASLAERALGVLDQTEDPADQEGPNAGPASRTTSISTPFGSRTAQDTPVALTRREAAVLRLLAVGKSNRDIGEQLVIGETTVASHVANIFAKIQATNRVEAAMYAWQHGLGPVSN